MNTDSYKDEHGPSERVIEAMADCLLKTPNCVTREEIIAAWRVAVSALSEQIRAMPRYDCASHDGDYGAGMEPGEGWVDFYELEQLLAPSATGSGHPSGPNNEAIELLKRIRQANIIFPSLCANNGVAMMVLHDMVEVLKRQSATGSGS